MKNILLFGSVIIIFLLFAGCINPLVVPVKYRRTYRELEGILCDFEKQIDSQWNGTAYSGLHFGAEILTANSMRGEVLLDESGWEGNMLYLTRLQDLGVELAQISVTYPVFNQETPHMEEYLYFYQRLANDIRSREMIVSVELTAAFPDDEYNYGLPTNFSNLTFDQYLIDMRNHVELIIEIMQPSYLTIITEPTTQSRNLGLNELQDPDLVVEYVNYILDGLNRNGTLIGGGAGMWENQSFFTQLASDTDLDYIDLHSYPLSNGFVNYLEKMIEYADIARSHGKRVTLGESWLFKASKSEVRRLNSATSSKIFKRDIYSFWEPLDQKYLEIVTKIAHLKQFDFISPFWTRNFFAYLPYSLRLEVLPYLQATAELNSLASQNMMQGIFTNTGMTYKNLIDNSTSVYVD